MTAVARAWLPLIPAMIAVVVMIVWAAHNGGYDADTWYWGALSLLSVLVATVGAPGIGWTRWQRALKLAFIAFTLYVAWSYLSITWAQYKGDALTGSNRALLYLIVFTLFAVVPWTAARARLILLLYAIAIGVIGFLIMDAMATAHHSGSLFNEGRLISPTGYFNSSAALFTSAAFVSVALSVRRELPALLRGLLLAVACGSVQLALLAQSRGWLFTLPFMLVAGIVVVPSRIRTTVAAILPTVGALAALSRLLHVLEAGGGYNANSSAVIDAAKHAGRSGLLACGAVFLIGTLLAAVDGRVRDPSLSRRGIRLLGGLVAALALAAAITGASAATHGHPVAFVNRQWQGFTHPSESSTSSTHFGVVGSGRYDAWRVALDAFKAHPIGGLGQDNYADYYIVHRRTGEELKWTHSIEMRLLAHTGAIGFILFFVFVLAALVAAIRNRSRDGPLGAMAGIAVLPFIVWMIHGSVDWFWEMPALSGPALGFLAMAAALDGRVHSGTSVSEQRLEPGSKSGAEPEQQPGSRLVGSEDGFGWARRLRALPEQRQLARAVLPTLGVLVVLAAVFALGFPYLSVREVSTAADVSGRNPTAALRDLSTAAQLDPFSVDPERLGGVIALQTGRFTEAERRFKQAVAREPRGWFVWLGAGLAASALGEAANAHHDYLVAAAINTRQPVISEALQRVFTRHPLTPSEAFDRLQLAP